MNLDTARAAIEAAAAAIGTARAALVADGPTVVKAGDSLQAALDKGGAIAIEAGAQFPGTYLLRSGTALVAGPGAAVRGATAPALMVPPGTSQVSVAGLECSSGHSEVIRIGENDATQTQAADAPTGITFTAVKVPTHRGKRAFSVHGAVSLIDCEAVDIYDPNGSDSQAVYVGNTPGPITITGGRYSAGSEVVLFGGDTTQIPHVTPDGILIDGVTLFRPLSWQTDGIPRKVKNLFELKNGRNVILRKSTLDGCWANGQNGEAIMLTPSLDGAKLTPPAQSGEVLNVLIEDCTIRNVGSVVNMLGRGYTCFTPNALAGVVFRRVTATASRAQFGGRGQLAILTSEPNDVRFEDCTVLLDGTSAIYYAAGVCLDPVTLTSRPAGKLGSLVVTGCKMSAPQYGFMFNGSANSLNWAASVGVMDVQGNVFGGSSAMAKAWPANEYLTAAEFAARVSA